MRLRSGAGTTRLENNGAGTTELGHGDQEPEIVDRGFESVLGSLRSGGARAKCGVVNVANV